MTLFVSRRFIFFLISVLALLSSIVFAFMQVRELKYSLRWVDRTSLIINRLESVTLNISESESVELGFILTGDELFINRYDEAVRLIKEDLDYIEKSFSSNPSQMNSFREIKLLSQKKISYQDESIQLKKSGGLSDNTIVDRFNKERGYLERIKEIKQRMEEEEELLLDKKQKIANRHILETLFGVLFSFILSVIVGFFLLTFIVKNIKEEEKLKTELMEINENKNKFFSVISHDLKGPINNILKLSELFNEVPQEEERMKINKMIESSSRKVYDLLSNLLNWANLQMNSVKISPQSIPLNNLVKESIITLNGMAESKNISLINKIETDAKVWADYEMLNTVIRNLISNGIKFTEREGKVTLQSVNKGEKIQILVSDNGMGMPEKIVSKLFAKDNTHSSAGTENEVGTGLGLQICKDFIEKNNGTISVESEVNKGSTFTIELWINESRN